MKRIKPGPGQESVWDYPRPPKLEKFSGNIRIEQDGITLVNTANSYRVLETSHPPVYYIPPTDIQMEYLTRSQSRNSFCEWKGMAGYVDYKGTTNGIPQVGWFYANPTKPFLAIKNYLAFYPSKVDECFVNDELVKAQEGDFYGGWITSNIVGPFKGASGTWGW